MSLFQKIAARARRGEQSARIEKMVSDHMKLFRERDEAMSAAKEWETCATQRQTEIIHLVEKLGKVRGWVSQRTDGHIFSEISADCMKELIDILQYNHLPNGAKARWP